MKRPKGPGVLCPDCLGSTRVRDTRRDRHGQGIRRRRNCLACGLEFVTVEETIVAPDHDNASKRRASSDLTARYWALGRAGRATVRLVITAIEEAEQRGARHEHAAAAIEAVAPAVVVPPQSLPRRAATGRAQ